MENEGMNKIEIGDYLIDEDIYNMYVRRSSHKIGFEEVCKAIDKGGGQTCDVNGVLKCLNNAGFMVTGK